jgi:CRP-like cAMP-binding protein
VLAPHHLDELSALGRRRRYERGQRVTFEGHHAGQVLLIHQGKVKVTTSSLEGSEVVLAIRGDGDVIGDQAALTGSTAGATVVALDRLDITQVGADEYVEFLRARPEVMLEQIRRLIGLVRESDTKLLEMSTLELDRRLARRLLELVGSDRPDADGSVSISTPMTQEELAGLCGSSREAVARVLRALREAGVVSTARRRIVIHDLDALRSLADVPSDGRA